METTRGQHWIYRGAMTSRNAVRPGVDVKSLMAYARWLGHGMGVMAPLPDAVRALAVKEPPSGRHRASQRPRGATEASASTALPTYLERGVAMAVQRITEARSAVHATVYRTFHAVLSTHGRCRCLTDTHVATIRSVWAGLPPASSHWKQHDGAKSYRPRLVLTWSGRCSTRPCSAAGSRPWPARR